ncbi:MAG: hypothetical protein ACR2KT_11775 [Methylocella sp.]|nr:MAG: hypothetical protein DLM68_06780 [Hyphomicrobiales bacterium]
MEVAGDGVAESVPVLADFATQKTAAMLFCALLASGQITMRKRDGWQSLTDKPFDQLIDFAA